MKLLAVLKRDASIFLFRYTQLLMHVSSDLAFFKICEDCVDRTYKTQENSKKYLNIFPFTLDSSERQNKHNVKLETCYASSNNSEGVEPNNKNSVTEFAKGEVLEESSASGSAARKVDEASAELSITQETSVLRRCMYIAEVVLIKPTTISATFVPDHAFVTLQPFLPVRLF